MAQQCRGRYTFVDLAAELLDPFFLLLGNIDFLEEAPKQSIGPVMLFVTGRQPISNEARAKHPLMRCVKCPCAGGLSFNEVRSTVVTARLQLERAMRIAIIIRWQSGAIALTAIIFAFLVPGVALCKVVSLISIAAAIAITTLVVEFGLYLTGRLVERRTPRCERVDHYLQASIFVIAAGLLWLNVVFANGSVAGEEY